MSDKKKTKEIDTTLFLEELQKRVVIPEGEFKKFLALWEYKEFGKNEFIVKAGEVPKFSIFVLKGCLRQYIINKKVKNRLYILLRKDILLEIFRQLEAKPSLTIIFKLLKTANC